MKLEGMTSAEEGEYIQHGLYQQLSQIADSIGSDVSSLFGGDGIN